MHGCSLTILRPTIKILQVEALISCEWGRATSDETGQSGFKDCGKFILNLNTIAERCFTIFDLLYSLPVWDTTKSFTLTLNAESPFSTVPLSEILSPSLCGAAAVLITQTST